MTVLGLLQSEYLCPISSSEVLCPTLLSYPLLQVLQRMRNSLCLEDRACAVAGVQGTASYCVHCGPALWGFSLSTDFHNPKISGGH